MTDTKLSDLRLGRRNIIIEPTIDDISYSDAQAIMIGAQEYKKFVITNGEIVYEDGKYSHLKLKLVLEW